ncbi:MAG: flagellin lysine-N-methylase [Clostridium sp.]|uniref:flagellin lysine-N-methylase n=1 Tax=Clostridium sp. TaxID=1506 RepID=UPI0025C31B5F|nr:flagellin lysine-N-methylase [Clostridium sp.]MCE5220766.1 flagellin lysine-N-methylase [Clostridium sp.]
MKILKPFYYDDFKCIADKCKDSCCIGWTVHIDKKSYNKYKKVKGDFGRSLNKNIVRNRKDLNDLAYGKMKLNSSRCPLLSEDNLCELYINLGKDYLCNTCKIYPRMVRKYGEIYEKYLTLSCPEVARIISSFNNPFSFNLDDEPLTDFEKEYISEEKYNNKLYNLLWEARSLSIEIAQFREIEIWKRLLFIKLVEEKIQNIINTSEYDQADNLINSLRESVIDSRIIESLDEIKKVDKVKLLFISTFLKARSNSGITNNTFFSLLFDFNVLVNEKSEDEVLELLENKEKEFNEYFKEKEYILENYIVYNLYNNYMKALYSKDLNKEIVRLILSYSVIKVLLIARWSKSDKLLKEEDIIDVLYSFSRVLEHSEKFIEIIYKNIKEAGYDTLAYLTILVR